MRTGVRLRRDWVMKQNRLILASLVWRMMKWWVRHLHLVGSVMFIMLSPLKWPLAMFLTVSLAFIFEQNISLFCDIQRYMYTGCSFFVVHGILQKTCSLKFFRFRPNRIAKSSYDNAQLDTFHRPTRFPRNNIFPVGMINVALSTNID